MAEGNIRSSGLSRDPGISNQKHQSAGEARWRDSRFGWWLTVLTEGSCAHACVRRSKPGWWRSFVSQPLGHGWQHNEEVAAGETLIEAMRKAEQAIARLTASAC